MLEKIFLHQKQYSLKLRTEGAAQRLEKLRRLEKALESHQDDILKALSQDLGKPTAECLLTEIHPVLHELRFTQHNLRKWMRPQKVSTPLTLPGSASYIVSEPRGVCLIISPWNYPFQLVFRPLISAVAAGNCLILKPSEISRHTSSLAKKIIESVFPHEQVFVAEGGAETTQALLNFPFDHIFFTGSARVGKLVMEAAAKHLSSITLELGGKSPTIVDSTADLAWAAERIAWAKFLNSGQTCIAPDYVFVHEEILPEFRTHLIEAVKRFFGSTSLDIKQSPDLSRIISLNHTQRIKLMIEDAIEKKATLIFGGDCSPEEHYCSPTILENTPLNSLAMQEEIFGPVLPLLPFRDLTEVLHFINENPKPLALYFFTHSHMNAKRIACETSSGGLVINDCLIHFNNPHLPFGGVNQSGFGSYHGQHGFRTFSHEKSIVKQSLLGKILRTIHPPYSGNKLRLLHFLTRWRL